MGRNITSVKDSRWTKADGVATNRREEVKGTTKQMEKRHQE